MKKKIKKTVEMPKKTLKALIDSIKHWERMQKNPDCGETPYGCECALCNLHYAIEDSCAECPVSLKTGQDDCKGSPWSDARFAWESHETSRGKVEWSKAATKMIKFLKSLLPEAKAPKAKSKTPKAKPKAKKS